MKKYVKPRIELIQVELHSLLASSGNNKISIGVDSEEQVVSGCSNQESFGSIWD